MTEFEFMVRASKIFGYILLYAGIALVALGLFGIYQEEGFSGIQRVMSPFNVWQYIAIAITLVPGMFFLWLSTWLHERKERGQQ